MNKPTFKNIIYAVCCVILAVCVVFTGALSIKSFGAYKDQDLLKSNSTADMMELFHDQGYVYMSDIEPDIGEKVTLRIRTGRYNVTKAKIQYTVDDGETWQETAMKFDGVDDTGYYDYWVGTIPGQEKLCRYRFVADNEGEKNLTYLYVTGQSSYQQDIEEMFYFIPGLKTPDWSKGTYWYFIQPDAFYNGDTSNDITDSTSYRAIPWGSNVTSLRQRYGGDLKGIIEKVSYLKDLGVESVYLNPIWISNSNVGYAPMHLYEISPYYGNDDDLINLIKTIHDKDMYLSLDAVFSNEPVDGVYVNTYHEFPLDGVYQDKNSSYKELFTYYQWPTSYKTEWGGVTTNFASDLLKNIYYKSGNSVIRTYLTDPYNIDAWRFDAVTYFFSSETSDTNVIAKDIRKYFKSINSNALMLAEEYKSEYIESGAWDACWNGRFLNASRQWFASELSQSDFFDNLRLNTVKLPRPYGLSTVNMYNSHDASRLSDDVEKDLSKIMAAQILSMTFVGSPCLYYGDEIGIENNASMGVTTQSRNSFNWNESEWNRSIYNLQKALGTLRKEYTALVNGAVKLGETNDINMTAVFGRFDKNGSVVSVLNQSNAVQNMEIDVKQFNVCDGDTLTDYLTGNAYKVENGKIIADILPGGAVLVTGGKTASNRGIFNISGKGVTMKNTSTFVLESASRFGKKTVASAECYGNITVETMPDGKGSAIIAVSSEKELGGEYYGVEIKKNKATVVYTSSGKEKKGKGIELKDGDTVCITRKSDNSFVAQIKSEDGKTETIDSSVQMDMPSDVYTCFEVLGGKLELTNLKILKNDEAAYDDFNGKSLASAFKAEGKKITLSNGKAIIDAEKTAQILSASPYNDYTLKAKISLSSEKLSVVDGVSEEEYVFVRRQDGSIIFGRHVGERDVVYGSAKDSSPDSDIILQLQRIGTDYSAVASYDGDKWFSVGADLQIGYSSSYCGIMVQKGGKAEVDYISFGDAVNDKSTICKPHTPYDVNASFSDMNHLYLRSLTEIIDENGEWEYCNGGIERKSKDGVGQIAVYSKVYNGFRAIATFDVKNDKGTAGFTFSRSEIDSTKGNAYVLSVNKKGEIELSFEGKKIISGKADLGEFGVKIMVERIGGKIHIFAGDAMKHIGSTDCEMKDGYFTYFAENDASGIYNYSLTDIRGSWVDYSGEYSFDYLGENGNIYVNTDELTFASLSGLGFSDVAISGDIDISRVSTETENESEPKTVKAGFVFGARTYEVCNVSNGFAVYYRSDGKVILESSGKTLAESKETFAQNKISLLAVVKNGVCKIYANNSETPVIEHKLGNANGGVVGLSTLNAKNADIYNFKVENIGENLEKDFFGRGYIGADVASTVYKTDFSKTAEDITDWYYPKGDWRFANGELSGGQTYDKWIYAGLYAAAFDDFTLNVKLRFDDSADNGFAAVSFGKDAFNAQYTGGGYSVMFYRSGRVRLYDGINNKYIGSAASAICDNYNASAKEFISLQIVKKGKNIRVAANGQEMFSYTLEEDCDDGYIGLHTSQAQCSFNELVVKP